MLVECKNAKELKEFFQCNSLNFEGLIFCFGTSFVSKLIQLKTRKYKSEKVPSHVAMYYKGFIYESTTEKVEVNNKRIPAGVRRWLCTDYLKSEAEKETSYVLFDTKLNTLALEKFVHYPYGKDTILDYLLKDGSDGESSGLICSQYANYCAKRIPAPCVTPAELYRAAKKAERQSNNKKGQE